MGVVEMGVDEMGSRQSGMMQTFQSMTIQKVNSEDRTHTPFRCCIMLCLICVSIVSLCPKDGTTGV